MQHAAGQFGKRAESRNLPGFCGLITEWVRYAIHARWAGRSFATSVT